MRRLAVFVAFTLLAVAAHAGAVEEDSSPSRRTARGALGVRTDVPLLVGGYAYLEHAPTRVRLSGAAGALPSTYARWVNDILTDAGAYDSRIGEALDDTLASSFAGRAHLGVRPFAGYGFLLETGYTFTTLVASGNALSALQTAAGSEFQGNALLDADFELRAALHMVDASMGWEWSLSDHAVLTAAIGLSYIFSASTSIEQRYIDSAPRRVSEAIDAGAERLDEAFTEYGFIPNVGLGTAVRF